MEFEGRTEKLEGLVTSLALVAGPGRGLILEVDDAGNSGAPPLQKAVGLLLVLGAGKECDVILKDRAVSRAHAEVCAAKGGVVVRDRGSTNGTKVNGALIKEAFVAVGGTFQIGESKVRVVDGGAPRLPPSTRDRFGGLVGESPVMREVFAVLERAAASPATVLLEGPSGTGKELAARALHDHSPRARARFVAFDCTSTSAELLPSALFGHKKGAFTGAVSDRAGAFVEADKGTLFLDEIGELPLASQAQLLRALEARTVTAVGDDRAKAVNVRVVAASHRDLFAMVDDGRFRLDLLHRLAVVHIRLPALHERTSDLPALVRAFYEGRGEDPGPVDGENLQALAQHPFDGNVRELRNILERSLVLAPAGARRFRDLVLWLGTPRAQTLPASTPATSPTTQPPELIDARLPYKEAKEALLLRFDQAYLPKLMALCGDNLTRAAQHAGLSRRHLRVLLVRAGLRKDSGDDDDG